jgi:hypothetical protein
MLSSIPPGSLGDGSGRTFYDFGNKKGSGNIFVEAAKCCTHC